MFCPECGEVIGSGPLDVRRARHASGEGFGRKVGRWLRALVRQLQPREG